MEKLQWKAKFDTKFTEEVDFLETILNGYGIQDIKGFINPIREKVLNNPFLFKNMEQAVELFHENLRKKIVIKVDPDVDGETSSALLTKIIKYFNPDAEIEYVYSFNKEHGLTFKSLAGYSRDDVGFIIIPDASMTCKDAILITKNFDAPILVLDHHIIEQEFLDTQTGFWVSREEARKIYKEDTSSDKSRIKVDCYTNYCVAVNCTDGEYPNPTLSGVGVVRKFGEAYCEKYRQDDSFLDDYLDLVSLGLIADAMDTRNLETRWYALEGLKEENQKNEFLNELHDRLKDDIHFGRNLTNIGWVLAPRINGVCRYGEKDEQINLFRAINGEKEEIEYQPRRKSRNDPKPPVEIHSLQWEMARVANNVKSRQDTEVRKFVTKIEDKIEKNNLLKNSVLFVDCSDIVDKKTVTGLVANKLASKYLRPVVLMKERNSQDFGGSCRGYEKGAIKDLKSFLEQAGVEAHGHSNAAGVFFQKADLDKIIAKCNEMLPLDQLCTIHDVDWEISANELKNQYVREVAENYAIWGNTVPAPTFAITNLRINASQIMGYGETKSFIRFQHNGVTYIKKYCHAKEYDMMTMKGRNTFGVNKKNLVLNIIGQFQLEVWEDKVYPQVKILYYDVIEDDNPLDVNTVGSKDTDWDDIETNVPAKKASVIDDDDFVF